MDLEVDRAHQVAPAPAPAQAQAPAPARTSSVGMVMCWLLKHSAYQQPRKSGIHIHLGVRIHSRKGVTPMMLQVFTSTRI